MLLIPSQSLQASWWASTLFLGYTILKHHYSCRIGQINLKQWLRLQFCGMGFLQRVFGMVIPGNMVNLPTGLTSDCSRSKVSYYREAVSRWLYFLPARRGYQGQEGSFQLCFFLFFFSPNVIQHSWIALLSRRGSSPASEPAALQHLHMRGSPEVHCSKGSNFGQELSSQQGNCCCAARLPLSPLHLPF